MLPIAADGRPLSVLIADAHEDGAESLAWVLRFHGHEVAVAASGEAALVAAERAPPDVVILEPRLPGPDVWDVVRRLRAAVPRPVCIVVATVGRAEDQQRSAAAGIDLHLVKPADPEGLVAALARFDGSRRLRTAGGAGVGPELVER